MKITPVVLGCCAALLVVCLVCWGYLACSRRRRDVRYDERQQKARLEAGRISSFFSYAYFGGLALYLAWACFYGASTPPAYLLVCVGLLLKLMAYHIYCIFSHAALPLGEKPLAAVTLYGGMAFFQGLYFWDHVRLGHLDTPGWEYGILNLIGAFCFGFLAVFHLITMLRKEKE